MAMADSKYMFPELDGGEKLIAAIKHIASALGAYTNLTDEARRVLVDLGTQLTSIAQPDEKNGDTTSEIASLLDVVQEKVMRCEADRYMIWDVAGPDEAFECLNAVDEARKLIERLEGFPLDNPEDEDKRNELQRRARDVLQNAMVRLEEEFKYILVQNRQAFGPVHRPLRSSDTDSLDLGCDSIERSVYKDCISRMSEEIIDFINKDAIPWLRSIANLMFNSKWDRECTQAYISVRKDAFKKCLFMLKVDEKLNIEELDRMDPASLKSKIRRWIHALKIFVRVFLASELCLCDQIFGELGSVTFCFINASKDSMLQLLDFGDAISAGPKKPENLILTLDMYEMLATLLPSIEAFYMGEEGSCVTMKYREVVRKLGDHARAAHTSFENALASYCTMNPSSKGGIHPLCRYVMNYMKNLVDYGETLNVLFKDHDEEREHAEQLSADLVHIKDRISSSSSNKLITYSFVSLTELLEGNLEGRSKLCMNASLQNLFMMNNIHYMVRKVKGSELKPIFGDEWIMNHNWKCYRYAMAYERACWGSVLSLLNDGGISNPKGSGSTWKILLKERLRSFYLAFEEIYRTQTAWTVTDEELREDLRILISLEVIPAYRSFVGRYCSSLDDKYIKYSADDLESYLVDLFDGTPKSL